MSLAYIEQEERPLPNSIEAEQSLFAAIFANPSEIMPIARACVSVEHFYDPVHQRIFDVMCRLHDAGTPPAVPVLLPKLRNDPDIGDRSIVAYLKDIGTSPVSVVSAADYATAIRDSWAARQAVEAGNTLTESVSAGEDAYSASRKAIEACDAIMAEHARTQKSNGTLGEAIEEALDDAEIRRERKEPAVSWGIGTLDMMTGGLENGDFCIVAGRPGMGKTATLIASMVQSARRGNGVVLFSLEMKKKQVGLRAACALASEWVSCQPINFFNVLTGRFTDDEMDRLRRALNEFRDLPIIIDDAGGLSVTDVTSRTRRYRDAMARRGQELSTLMVDGLGLMRPTGAYKGNKVAEVTEISNGLKAAAMQLDLPVVAASQLNRGVESRDDKRPHLQDLRDSGSLEQDASVVVFPYRAAYYMEKEASRIEGMPNATPDDMQKLRDLQAELAICGKTIEFIIGKQRMGPGGSMKAYADMATGIIRTLESQH